MKKFKVIIFALLFCNICLFVTGCGGPSNTKVYSALSLRRASVIGTMLRNCDNTPVNCAHGPVDINIENKYTRETNGVTLYYYDFSLTTRFETNKDKVVEIDSGTIIFEKRGKYWEYYYD